MSTLEVALDDRQAVSKPDGEENPYLSARRTWNSQVERAFAAAHTWQIIGIIGMLIGLGGVGGMVWLGSLPRFTPYIIEVDKLGEAVAVGPADRAAQADNRVIRASLASFVSSARTVTPDVALQREAVFRAYAMLQRKDPAKQKLDEWWSADKKADPFSRAANETVAVEVVAALPISEKAWQVDWLETVRDRDGALKEPASRMRAVLHVYLSAPDRRTTEQEIARNPLGVFVRDFNWSRVN